MSEHNKDREYSSKRFNKGKSKEHRKDRRNIKKQIDNYIGYRSRKNIQDQD